MSCSSQVNSLLKLKIIVIIPSSQQVNLENEER